MLMQQFGMSLPPPPDVTPPQDIPRPTDSPQSSIPHRETSMGSDTGASSMMPVGPREGERPSTPMVPQPGYWPMPWASMPYPGMGYWPPPTPGMPWGPPQGQRPPPTQYGGPPAGQGSMMQMMQ